MVWNVRSVGCIQIQLRCVWKNAIKSLSTSSLYVHWPYCKRRCTYCNFNKYIDNNVDHQRMKLCLTKEATTLLKLSGVEEVTSVFVGGGTPSLAKPATIESLLNAVRGTAQLSPTAEISMEINPTALEMNILKEFKLAGVNRVSIGIQTLNRTGLQILGRDHSDTESLRCLEMAKTLFPDHVSVDFIFGWPGQTFDLWLSELNQILPLCDNHISLYQLTLERGTHLFKMVQRGSLESIDCEVIADMYLGATEVLSRSGFERYEVSNFARQNCYGLHNISYWSGQQYIGVGPGAHGRFKPVDKDLREARIQTLEPSDWMWEVESFGHATRKSTPLTPLQQLEELLIVGLRTKWGVSNDTWSKICPEKSIEEMLLPSPVLESYLAQGLLKLESLSGLRASDEGINVLDTILPVLLNALTEAFTSKLNVQTSDVT